MNDPRAATLTAVEGERKSSRNEEELKHVREVAKERKEHF